MTTIMTGTPWYCAVEFTIVAEKVTKLAKLAAAWVGAGHAQALLAAVGLR